MFTLISYLNYPLYGLIINTITITLILKKKRHNRRNRFKDKENYYFYNVNVSLIYFLYEVVRQDRDIKVTLYVEENLKGNGPFM